MENISVLSSCLSVCDTVRQPKLWNFSRVWIFFKNLSKLWFTSNCPVIKCTLPKAIKDNTGCIKTPLRNVCIAFCRTQRLPIGTPLALGKTVGVPAQVTGATLPSFFDTSFLLSLLPSREPWASPRARYSPVLPTSHRIFPVLLYSLATDL